MARDYTFTDKNGREHTATLTYTVGEGAGPRLRDLGRQIVNRSADASDTPMFVNREMLPEILVKEAFPDATVKVFGETRPATSSDFHNAYPSVTNSITSVNPRSKNFAEGGRNLYLYERQAQMRGIDPTYDTDSLWSQLSKRVRDKGLDRDYRRDRLDRLIEIFSSEDQSSIIKMALSDAKISNTFNKGINEIFRVFFELSPQTVRRAIEAGDIKKAEELMFHDVNQIAGRNAIIKSFESILNTMKAEEISDLYNNPDNVSYKAFKSIVKIALNSKKKIYNMQRSDSPIEDSKSTSGLVDNLIQKHKAEITKTLLSQPEAIDPNPFTRLYETIILSPF